MGVVRNFRSRSGKPNMTDSRLRSRNWGTVLISECLLWRKTSRRIHNTSKVPEGHHASEGHNPPRGSREPLSGEICLSEGSAGVSQRALRSLSEGSAGSLGEGSAGLWGGPRDFPRFFGGSDPMLVTLGKFWKHNAPCS